MKDKTPQRDSSAHGHLLIYLALTAAHVALVWLLPFFPSQDGPNHLYNLVILRDMLHAAGGWESHYALTLHVAPNLGFTLLAYPWLSVSPIAAERIFLTVYVLLMAAAAPAFLRAFGRPAFPVSYFVFVAIFSQPVMMGFYSEIVGTPLVLLGLALVWKTRARSPWVRFVVLNVSGLVIFVAHLIPFGIYILAVLIEAAAEEPAWAGRPRRVVLRAAMLLPAMAPAGIFYFAHHAGAELRWSIRPGNILRDLFCFGEYTFSYWQLVPGLAAGYLACDALRAGLRKNSGSSTSSESVARRFLSALCLILLVIYIFAPNSLGGGQEFQRRLPPLILLLGLPLLAPQTPRLTPRRYAQLTASVACLVLLLNAALFWSESRRVAQFVRGMDAVPRGALLVTARLDGEKHSFPDPLYHAAGYYGIEGAVDLGQYLDDEVGRGTFPSRFSYFELRLLPTVSGDETSRIYNGTLRASALPDVQYALCWGSVSSCQQGLVPEFAIAWNEANNPLSIWKSAREGAAAR